MFCLVRRTTILQRLTSRHHYQHQQQNQETALMRRVASDQTLYSREPIPCFIESTQVKVSGTASRQCNKLWIHHRCISTKLRFTDLTASTRSRDYEIAYNRAVWSICPNTGKREGEISIYYYITWLGSIKRV